MEIAVLTGSEIKKVERTTSKLCKINESQMIAQAGFAVFSSVLDFLENTRAPKKNRWVILCGKGHNGADGLQCGLFAIENNIPVTLYQLHSDKGYSPETVLLQNQIKAMGHKIKMIEKKSQFNLSGDTGLIIDGLLGSGLGSTPKRLTGQLIDILNKSNIPVFSIDVPSGISTDMLFSGSHVRAAATLSLGGANVSSLFLPSLEAYGRTFYSTLCFPREILQSQPSKTVLFQKEEIRNIYPMPSARAHKHSMGKVLVIAGSRGMHGAALMAATSALRTGAGLVKLALPRGVYRDVSKKLTEVIGIPVGQLEEAHFQKSHLRELEDALGWCDVIVAGPGVGRHSHTLAFLKQLVEQTSKPVILDGDGLGCYDGRKAPLRKIKKPVLVTPHEGEYIRMGGKYNSSDPWDHIKNAKKLARQKNLHIILKGPTTIYVNIKGECTVLPRGNPGLATAGSGDVLSGILGAFLSKSPVGVAARLGVTLHSLAAEIAAKKKGTRGMIATDIIKYIPVILSGWEWDIKKNRV